MIPNSDSDSQEVLEATTSQSTELSVVVFNSSKPNDLVFLFFLHLKSKAQLCYTYISLDMFMPPSAHADASHWDQ
jgi:hypothetical protein